MFGRSIPHSQLGSASTTSLYVSADARVVHIAAKVMRYLNSHEGLVTLQDTVPIPSVPFTLIVSPGKLMEKNKNEMKDMVAKKEKQDANECSKSVASHVQREAMYAWEQIYMLEYPTPLHGMASSLTTNIRHTQRCRHTAQTLSNRALNACLGGAYFKYQQKFLD